MTALVYVSVSAVMCGNIAQGVNSLCFIQRSIKSYSISLFLVRTQSLTDTNKLWQTLTDSLSLSDSLTLWITDSVPRYICGSTSWSISTSAQTHIAKPNMVRNGALTSYSRAPSLINSQHLLGRHTEVSRQPRGTPTFHIRHPGFPERATPAVSKISWLARYALGQLATNGAGRWASCRH